MTDFLRPLAMLAVATAALPGPGHAQSDFDISSQIGPDPVLPDPDPALVAGMKLAEVIGWGEGETPQVPEGLTVTAYARDLVNPRTVYTLPNGDVLVVQARGPSIEPVSRPKDLVRGWLMAYAHGFSGGGEKKESNLVTLLRDTNRDGTVEERTDLLTGLNSPFGIAWIDGTLYVGATDAILAYPYELGQTEITEPPEVLTPLPGGPIDHHWTKDLTLSPDGSYIFVGVGSNSNIVENGLEAEKGRAAIWEVDRETGAARVYASGLRNPNGLTINPDTGELWAVINERDELGPNLVPDYLTSVKDGAFYGWPWSYYGDHVDERVYPRRPDMVEKAIPPDYALSSHVAPLGLTFSNNSALPGPFDSGAFIGEHGSWNRERFNGYRVVFVPFLDGKPVGKAVDVVTGFLDGDQAHGRPVGVAIDGTGALLVADDAGNTVWRVAAADGTITDEPVGTDEHARVQGASSESPRGQTGQGEDRIGGSEANGNGGASQGSPSSTGGQQSTGTGGASQDAPQGTDGSQRTGGNTNPAQTEVAPATGPDAPEN